MLHDIKEFIHYKYDDEKKVVISTYGKVEKLKWLTLKGRRRVTLRRNKNPHWLFENQIHKMLGLQIATLENNEVIKEKVSKKTKEQEINQNNIGNQTRRNDIEFWIKFDEVKKFLEERQKPFRRDQFQVKFGKEFLEECLEKNLLEEVKIASFKFYNLKK